MVCTVDQYPNVNTANLCVEGEPIMKKKLFVLALVAICVAIVAAGTLAYFTGETTAHNVITTGGVKVEVIEKTDGGKPFPEEGVTGVMPGQSVGKEVTVKNVGPSEAWVRLSLQVEFLDAEGSIMDVSDMPFILEGVNPEKWEGQGMYIYYKEPLAEGESTEPFMESVKFTEEMGNEFQNTTMNMDIQVQAVQTANNGETVFEAQGWPET